MSAETIDSKNISTLKSKRAPVNCYFSYTDPLTVRDMCGDRVKIFQVHVFTSVANSTSKVNGSPYCNTSLKAACTSSFL